MFQFHGSGWFSWKQHRNESWMMDSAQSLRVADMSRTSWDKRAFPCSRCRRETRLRVTAAVSASSGEAEPYLVLLLRVDPAQRVVQLVDPLVVHVPLGGNQRLEIISDRPVCARRGGEGEKRKAALSPGRNSHGGRLFSLVKTWDGDPVRGGGRAGLATTGTRNHQNVRVALIELYQRSRAVEEIFAVLGIGGQYPRVERF